MYWVYFSVLPSVEHCFGLLLFLILFFFPSLPFSCHLCLFWAPQKYMCSSLCIIAFQVRTRTAPGECTALVRKWAERRLPYLFISLLSTRFKTACHTNTDFTAGTTSQRTTAGMSMIVIIQLVSSIISIITLSSKHLSPKLHFRLLLFLPNFRSRDGPSSCTMPVWWWYRKFGKKKKFDERVMTTRLQWSYEVFKIIIF